MVSAAGKKIPVLVSPEANKDGVAAAPAIKPSAPVIVSPALATAPRLVKAVAAVVAMRDKNPNTEIFILFI
jgi:hypothetical protein